MLPVNLRGCLEVTSTKELEAGKWIEKWKLAPPRVGVRNEAHRKEAL